MHRTARCIGRLESLAKPAGARPPRPRRWFLARARPTRRLSARSGTAAIDEACSRSPRADSSVPEHPGRRALESAHGLLYAATPRLPSPRTARHTDRPTDRGTGTRPDRRRLRRLTANARRVEPASRAAVRLERAQRVGVSVHDGMFFDDCRRRGDRSSPCPYDPATASCSLDKLIGSRLRTASLPLAGHLLVVSGRSSFEIVQKAIAAGIPIVAAVSAPSSPAIDLANRGNVTLIGFTRGNAMTVYTGPERIC